MRTTDDGWRGLRTEIGQTIGLFATVVLIILIDFAIGTAL